MGSGSGANAGLDEAASGDAPRLVTLVKPAEQTETPAPAKTDWALLGVLVGVGLAGLVMTHLVLHRRARLGVSERAFRAMTRRLGLSRASRRLVRELAEAHGSATPNAVLISEHARRDAAERYLASREGEAARVRELLEKLAGA